MGIYDTEEMAAISGTCLAIFSLGDDDDDDDSRYLKSLFSAGD